MKGFFIDDSISPRPLLRVVRKLYRRGMSAPIRGIVALGLNFRGDLLEASDYRLMNS
jgi:hypothetical protein